MRYPLLLPALGLLAGTLLIPAGIPAWLLLAISATPLLAAALLARDGRRLHAVVLASLSVAPAGALNRDLAEREYAARLLPPSAIEATSREYADITGTIRRLPRMLDRGRTELEVTVENVRLFGGATIAGPFVARIVVQPSEIGLALPDLLPGDRARIGAKIFPTAGFRNPGGFDPMAYMQSEGVHHRGSTKSPGLVHKIASGGIGIRRLAAVARRSLSGALRSLDAPNDGAGTGHIAAALILGEREALDPQIHESMRKSGLYHLLAISGGNFALLAYIIFVTLRIASVPDRMREPIVLGLMLIYAAMVEFEPSVMRSFLMIAAYLVGTLIDRDHALGNAFSLALIVSIWASPAVTGDAGFQLTFLATALILASLQYVRGDSPLSRWATGFLAVNVATTAGLAPYLAYYFNRVALGGLLLNLLAMPLSGVIMVLGFVAPAINAISAIAARPFVWLLSRAVDSFLALSNSVPSPSILAYRIPSPHVLVVIAFYALATLSVVIIAGRRRRIAAFAATSAVWLLIVAWPFTPRPGGLRFTFIDVGQGDSVLVEFPGGGARMLVDGGGDYDDSFDYGERVVAPYLYRRGIRRLDYVVVSHAHPDHVNGLRYIVANFECGEVWEGVNPMGDGFSRKLRDAIPQGVSLRQVARGETLRVGETTIEVLHPATRVRSSVVRNDDSVVLRFIYGDTTALLPGDIEMETERALVDSGMAISATLLKSAHHGSRTSSTARFLDAVAPEIAVISLGRRNRWGLPHPEVIDAYRARRIELLRTDLSGAVAIELDGHGWRRADP